MQSAVHLVWPVCPLRPVHPIKVSVQSSVVRIDPEVLNASECSFFHIELDHAPLPLVYFDLPLVVVDMFDWPSRLGHDIAWHETVKISPLTWFEVPIVWWAWCLPPIIGDACSLLFCTCTCVLPLPHIVQIHASEFHHHQGPSWILSFVGFIWWTKAYLCPGSFSIY